jgi:hypothetical protein
MIPTIRRNAFGPEFGTSFFSLSADGTTRGIVLAVNSSLLQLSDPVVNGHTISAKVSDLRYNRS